MPEPSLPASPQPPRPGLLRRCVGSLASWGARPGPRRFGRVLAWTAVGAWFVFGTLVLVLRYAILPQIENYREDVARLLTSSLGLKVDIEGITAGWNGLEPDLMLKGFKVRDKRGQPALAFDEVEASLSWSSLVLGKLVLAKLEIDAPSLAMRRETDGRIYIAGIPLNTESSGNDVSDWLLAQRRIVIRQARVSWEDASRSAPRLELQGVNLLLENFGSHHRFALSAEPPATLASRLDLRGDFRGVDLDQLDDWHGQAYAAMDYADLAVWRKWVDYPLDLPQGVGGLRLWLTVAKGRLTAATADLALRDVNLRLHKELPALDLAHLEGRLKLVLPDRGFEATAQGLSLLTREGIRLDPTDFSLKFAPAVTGSRPVPAHGEVLANMLDFAPLKSLAAYLPLDARTRQRLLAYGPEGRLLDLKLTWQGDSKGLAGYTVKSRFERLGVQAVDGVPGFDGLSGSLEGNDQAGVVNFESRDAALLMPAIFIDPRLVLQHMTALLNWKMAGDELKLELKHLNFDNRDAQGTASGSYRWRPGQVGVIDLTAQLSRGEGNAVWRYMPLVVNHSVRDWLQTGIKGGASREAKLRLQGDLKDFPFADGKSGIFQVTGKFEGVTLHYAPDWPDLLNVSGDLLFEGVRMLIRGDKGSLYGVKLSGVTAEIPHLGVPEPVLKVMGRAAGPTQDFLHFIDESPVSKRIEHFTAGMAAEGAGSLGLTLILPLQRLQDSTVQGEYLFVNNRLTPDPGMPPLTEVNGRLNLSDKGVSVKTATARLLGSPLNLSAQTRNDGTVAINAQGTLSVASLRRNMDQPLLDHLSGTTPWRARVVVKKRNVDLELDSSLQGIASSLPEPFNKSATDALPLHLEREQGEAAKDSLKLTLGKVLSAQFLRHQQGGRSVVERGAVALQGVPRNDVGEPPGLPLLPEKGVVVAANLKSLNVDFWRHLFAPGAGGEKGEEAFPVTALALKSGELTAFGRSFSELSLKGQLEDDIWRLQVAGKDIAGSLSWSGRGRGRLQARLQQFSLGDVKPAALAEAEEPLRELPALDVVVDNFKLRGLALGKLELDAVNRGNTWQVRRLALNNPDGSLSGGGQWRLSATAPESRLNFKLETKNIGKLLERLGFPGAVKNGNALLSGDLSWHGVPTALDYPTLQGKMSLEASHGQFAKLEPGVGRLLGILSLQSLPRRLTLDFRDVFSDGFSFDSISGDMQVDKGLLTTRNLQIQGPAAHVAMSGEASLAKETQNLLVRVQPSLGDSVAMGAMIVNPVAGVATYLAQKLLKDPLGHIFEFDYAISGSWKDPKVEKLGAVAKPATNGEK